MVSRNNIFHIIKDWHDSVCDDCSDASNDFDYDLYNGDMPQTSQANGIDDVPVYDPENAHGEFALDPSSPGFDAGVRLAGFNDGFVGVAPDMGAYEAGASVAIFSDGFESGQFIVMSAADVFQNPTRYVHELWQTDFTYFRIIGWGWYFLSTILDDYSRYIISWRLTTTMAASDVTDTLEDALKATGLTEARVHHKPRLLSDNGPCYISKELREWLQDQDMKHTRGAPYHPMTQGKIERYHRSMKNVVKLKNYYFPWELEHAIAEWVAHYNHERYHESLDNVTPADVYNGRRNEILDRRSIIKSRTLTQRKVQNLRLAG